MASKRFVIEFIPFGLAPLTAPFFIMEFRSSIRRGNGHFRGPRQKQFRGHRGNNSQAIHSSRYINAATTPQETPPVVIRHTFSDFGLHPTLLNRVLHRGYTQPTPIQDQTIIPILQGQDVVGIANTGTGKTAAFLLPLITMCLQNRQNRVLVMCPTRELATQIHDELKAFSPSWEIAGALCIGGASLYNQIGLLRRQPTFVIGTPGRLRDLVNQNALSMAQFSHVVLDEVDRMVDIGFLKEIRSLLSLLPSKRQSLFFSATVTPEVTAIMHQFLSNPITVSVLTQETAQTVDQDIIKVSGPDDKFAKLTDLLHQDDFRKVLIFGRTKWGVEKLAKNLDRNGFRATAIHGNKSQNQRQRALDLFKQNNVQVLVATDVASRGLDIPGVTHVINYDEPATYEDYVHRIGRTGRANNLGKALTFVG